ncbi:PREDICTED: putative ankyrin repeat protein RF_0381 [Priapulus caudatus]|uniref:Ankyrin repeat protein RF_0381 n=1 Tax=Priapulus caudatus TaxID=37621 RepID=A0ABM1EJM3_PRICU|nr:PREDICTED: putative ankyrin repeat protein RF_0381 [Priapulus caudatus]
MIRGETPLMMVVRESEEAVVQMLLSHGADANAADSYGQTSLFHAAYSGQLNIMHLLLEAAAKPNVADTESGKTLLMKAVKEGEEAAVRMLLSHGADANAADLHGQTILYHAACFGRLDIVRLLLEAGADANAVDSYGRATLYPAACFGRLDIMRLLLEAGANPNVADTQTGKTPLMMAAWKDKEAAVWMLLSHGADTTDSQRLTTLYNAACYRQLEIMRMLLEAGADANAADSYGVTSLHIAARSGQLYINSMMGRGYANLNVVTTEERGCFSVLHYSCDRPRTEMIALLLKHGADPNLVDCNKMMPLAIIGSEAELRCTRMSERGSFAAPAEQAGLAVQAASALLQTCESAGVLLQVNTRDSVGDTPLHSICRAMLACKDDVYARERDGWVQIVHALLFNHGAHVDVVNARGETSYELWRRIYLTRFHCNMQSSDEIHGRMSAQYHSLECYCARVIVRHSVAYENRLPPSLIEFVRAHARPT